jgi:hypothetical protein
MELSNVILTKEGFLRDDIPGTLDEAIAELNRLIVNANELKLLHESTFLVRTHEPVGTVLRSKWLLWDDKSPLNRWFFDNMGIFNADDIVTIMLVSFHRFINGKEYNLIDLARKKLEWWEKQEPIDKNQALCYLSEQLDLRLSKLISPQEASTLIFNFYYQVEYDNTSVPNWIGIAIDLFQIELKLSHKGNFENKSEIDSFLDRLINDLLST